MIQHELLEITVNRRRFERQQGVKELMTASEIAALVGIPSVNAVVEREISRNVYEVVSGNAPVVIADRMHFLVTREFVMGG